MRYSSLPSMAVLLAAVTGCGDDGQQLDAGEGGGGQGGGDGAGWPTAGVPEGACAVGFASDGKMGCDPVLPAEPCASGTMAALGETSCRPIAPCGTGTWGDIPVDSTTQYVDGSYGGGSSDGSLQHPWLTIGEAVTAASDGGLIAVAAGSYDEDLDISAHSLRLWGRCPELVTIAGLGVEVAAVRIHTAAAKGTEIHDIAVTGGALGIVAYGVSEVTFDRLWVHDTAGRGVDVEAVGGATDFALTRSLVERASEVGVFVFGAEGAVDASEVRDTQPSMTQEGGSGIMIERIDGPFVRSNATVTGSVVERSHGGGIIVIGSDATIEGTLVRDTQPQALDGTSGRGILIQGEADGERSVATLRGVVVAGSHQNGVYVWGSDAFIEHSVVRDSLPQQATQQLGRGISFEQRPETEQRAAGAVIASLIERNLDVGLFVAGSDVTVERTLVRDMGPDTFGKSGRCVAVRYRPETASPGSLHLRSSVLQGCHDVGLHVYGSTATIESTVIADVAPRQSDHSFGDGLVLFPGADLPAHATVTDSWIERAARAGVAVFGASVDVGTSRFECNLIHLDRENIDDMVGSFTDLGVNTCGCNGEQVACAAVSSSLVPPETAP
ncbi:MAG: right-handed parallel beta-helix repeat-containing protein [Deltaproteobacteria bacterium]|nr:right-handed parallel beta-helix repeat-containing protein [Deltaproteobacteria bacterium]